MSFGARALRSASGSTPPMIGERSAVMSWAMSWPKKGQPAASAASSRPGSSRSRTAVASQTPPSTPARTSSCGSVPSGARPGNMRP
ncbi:hypothetical protein ACFQZ4_02835 [Catellatospora coxensis]